MCYPSDGLCCPCDGVCCPCDGVCCPSDGVCCPSDGVCCPSDGVCCPSDGVCCPSDVMTGEFVLYIKGGGKQAWNRGDVPRGMSRDAPPPNMGPYSGQFNYPPPPGSYPPPPPNPYMIHPHHHHHQPPGESDLFSTMQFSIFLLFYRYATFSWSPSSGRWEGPLPSPPRWISSSASVPLSGRPLPNAVSHMILKITPIQSVLSCSDGYHDNMSRPPTVKMDDIKNMDVGEEEEGGWAGHHEEVDYSKEVVFSDSSDEEGSAKKILPLDEPAARESHSSEVREQTAPKPKYTSPLQQDKFSEEVLPSDSNWRRSGNESPVDRGIDRGSQKDNRHKNPKDRERRLDGASFHPYSRRPGSYPSGPQYPNYGSPYQMYPPPFDPRGHHYPPQHMGGGGGNNRYPVHRGGGTKRNSHDRSDQGWTQDRQGKGGGANRKKWEEEIDSKKTILSKTDKVSTSGGGGGTGISPENQLVEDESFKKTPIQRTTSGSSETQEGGASKGHVTFAEDEEVPDEPLDQQLQPPPRRGNQPKIMLRKLGGKETDASGEGTDKSRDGKGHGRRPADLKGVGEGDDQGADSAIKMKTAWNVKDRGPITSPKTLYEPEGKKSADKFKKYHAQSQEPPRKGSKSDQDEPVPPEEVASPVDREVEMGSEIGKPEGQHPGGWKGVAEKTTDAIQPHGRTADVNKHAHDGNRHGNRDKPNHRKEDVKRSKTNFERNSSNRSESKQDYSREGYRRDSQDNTRGTRQHQDKKHTDHQQDRKHSDHQDKNQQEKRQFDHHDKRQHSDHKSVKDERGKQSNTNRDNNNHLEQGRIDKRSSRKETGRSATTDNFNRGGGGGRTTIDNLGRGSSGRKLTEQEVGGTKPADARLEPLEHDKNKHQTTSGSRPGARKPGGRSEDRRQDSGGGGGRTQYERPLQQRGGDRAKPSRKASELAAAQDGRNVRKKERSHPAYGYGEVIDIESSSESDSHVTDGTHPVSNHGEGISAVTSANKTSRDDYRPSRGTQPTHGRGVQPIPAHNSSNKSWQDKKKGMDKRPGEDGPRDPPQRVGSDKSHDPPPRVSSDRSHDAPQWVGSGRSHDPQRVGSGRGRGRDKRGGDPGRPIPMAHHRHGTEEQKKGGPLRRGGGVDAESDESTDNTTESSTSHGRFDVTAKYDLNSHKVAIVDEIGSHGLEEGHLSPTSQGEFVEVTSKKTQKEKIRKEKEEQKKEEKQNREEQRKKKKNAPIRARTGVDKSLSSTNKPYSAWSASEGKSEAEIWNAAPGSHLKTGPATNWVAANSSSGFRPNPTNGGGGGGGGGGTATAGNDSKMPHTAELVVSDPLSSYSLFGIYTPFPPQAAATMLDAAVDSSIGTVGSSRAVTTGHASLIPHDANPANRHLESLVSREASVSEGSKTIPLLPPHPSLPGEPRDHVIPHAMGESMTSKDQAGSGRGGVAKNLPPRFKPARGRGGGQRSVEKRERRRVKDHAGTSEKHSNIDKVQ